jgi:elongation factor P
LHITELDSTGKCSVTTFKTNDFRKGLKVQIDGEPYLMVAMNFVKPGKGNAFYKCRLKNLIRNTVIDRTYKGGDSLEGADVEEIDCQYLYRQADAFVFMDAATFEQYELTADQVDENWKYLKDGISCSMVLFNEQPITLTPPNHVELKVEYCEPGAKGDTATNVTKLAKVETGAEFVVPSFINIGDVIKIDSRTGDYVERVRS